MTPLRTEIIIRATRTQNVLGEKGQRIRELTSVVQKRFHFQDGAVELYAERVANRGLCAQAQASTTRVFPNERDKKTHYCGADQTALLEAVWPSTDVGENLPSSRGVCRDSSFRS